MKAIVDCNSFYCSCERVFAPHLDHQPVVVLSNNDGCIISRSDEAKALGLEMTVPYFKVRQELKEHQVAVFSSNYNLYGNMSWRVMETLKELAGKTNVEVYSVDEAFVDLHFFNNNNLKEVGNELRAKVEMWTGIKVSVGIAPTKTLAKLANYLAKKDKDATGCVTVLDNHDKIREALMKTRVSALWGVGSKFADKLTAMGIRTGWDLYNMSEAWMRGHLGGVVGIRLLKELHGEEAIGVEKELSSKKMIATTRMFGNPVMALSDIKEAVASYTSRAAEKLRRQQSAASMVSVFVVPKEEKNPNRYHRGTSVGSHHILASPTSLTQELIKPALKIAESLFENGRAYKKAGVILSGLVPDHAIQANLFHKPGKNALRFLMEQMDNINFSMRDDVVKFASSGTARDWKMRQEYHSPRYTTRWDELHKVG